ncbi:MAG: 2-C-methyl-D-erythritol 4-phosphate cytidylyltransferase [Actinobacteria bacterium]|nr:2-C-methyl-D-erythritol 4-phosphate cytidylyltransferase [Actinomycetota bacterium]
MTTAAIVLAGGSGSRMRRDDNKVFAQVHGLPLIAWSIRTFGRAPSVDHLIVVARAGEHTRIAAVVEAADLDIPVHTTIGGTTRQDSERAGLDVIARSTALRDVELVLIHDAARPFATADLVERVIATTAAVGGAVPALPLDDGVYRTTSDGHLAPRPDDLYRMQTPQGFRTAALLDAYRRAADDGFAGVDTAETVQRYTSLEVAIVPGEADNIKVTFSGDLAAAERIAARHAV